MNDRLPVNQPAPPTPAPAPAAPRVQWNRVARYVAVYFAATLVAGFIGGFMVGFARGIGTQPPAWTIVAGPVLIVVATIGVFVWIGRVQTVLSGGHAALVWTLGCVAGFLLNVLLLGMPLGTYFGSVVMSGVFAATGTAIGAASRGRR